MPTKSKSRILLMLLICGALLYFAIGGGCVWFGYFSADKYASIGGLVGSVASIIGLVSLSRPALTQTDISQIEIESLKKLAETSAELKQLETVRIQEMQRLETTKVVTAEQIQQLKQQKEEMEYLVRKASIVLLLQEQHKGRIAQVLAELEKTPALKELLGELKTVEDKLHALEEEIETSPHVELLKSVIRISQRKDDVIEEFVGGLPSLARILFRAYIEMPREIVRYIQRPLRH